MYRSGYRIGYKNTVVGNGDTGGRGKSGEQWSLRTKRKKKLAFPVKYAYPRVAEIGNKDIL